MQEEKYGTRDMSYSAWHRRNSTQRFIGIENAQLLSMIDLDVMMFVEYDESSRWPVALIEVAQDVGQSYKTATVTKNLAIMAKIPSAVLLYRLSKDENPGAPGYKDIEMFRYKRIYPDEQYQWTECTPELWAKNLIEIRKAGAKTVDAFNLK